MSDPAAAYAEIRDEMSKVLVDNEDVIEHLTIGLLTNGHVLLEGVPGVAKTTTAHAFARAFGMGYRRIQMTPDMLPTDIIGSNVYYDSSETFEIQKGPIFSNLVVADEINRATPKTQSALLEAMEEGTVTIDGETLSLPEPFMLIATQNPIEMEGTFELPVAQRDRFQFKTTIETPERAVEREILDRFDDDATFAPDAVSPVLSPEEVRELREAVRAVHVADPIKTYVLDLVASVRTHSYVEVGPSTRASLAFLSGAKARAAIYGRDYVITDDIKALTESVLAHRPVLSTEARLGEVQIQRVIEDAIADVETPSETQRETDGTSDVRKRVEHGAYVGQQAAQVLDRQE